MSAERQYQSEDVQTPPLDDKDGGSEEPKIPCRFYQVGQCNKGQACPFVHTKAAHFSSTKCKFFLNGACRNGSRCPFTHSHDTDAKKSPKKDPKPEKRSNGSHGMSQANTGNGNGSGNDVVNPPEDANPTHDWEKLKAPGTSKAKKYQSSSSRQEEKRRLSKQPQQPNQKGRPKQVLGAIPLQTLSGGPFGQHSRVTKAGMHGMDNPATFYDSFIGGSPSPSTSSSVPSSPSVSAHSSFSGRRLSLDAPEGSHLLAFKEPLAPRDSDGVFLAKHSEQESGEGLLWSIAGGSNSIWSTSYPANPSDKVKAELSPRSASPSPWESSRSVLSQSEPSRSASFPNLHAITSASSLTAASNSSFFSHKRDVGVGLGSPRHPALNLRHRSGPLVRSHTSVMEDAQEGVFMGYPLIPASTSPIYPLYSPTITDSPSPSPRSRYTPGSSAPASPMSSSSLIRPPSSNMLRPQSSSDSLSEPPAKTLKDELDWEEDLFYFYQPPDVDELAITSAVITPSPKILSPKTLPSGRTVSPISNSPRNINPAGFSSFIQPSKPIPPLSSPIACRSGGRNLNKYYDSSEEDDEDQENHSLQSKGSAEKLPSGSYHKRDHILNVRSSIELQDSGTKKICHIEDNRGNSDSDSDNNESSKCDSEKKSPYLLALQSTRIQQHQEQRRTAPGSTTKPNGKMVKEKSPTLSKEAPSARISSGLAISHVTSQGRSYSKTSGTSCPYCTKVLSGNEDTRNAHFIECSRKHQQKVELESSKVFRCQKCNIKVVENGLRFGLLVECNHCFCLPCIKEWRSDSANRDCPVCGVLSHFVVPSNVMIADSEKKATLISNYKYKMKLIPCKYIESGTSACKFGDNCHYSHSLPSPSLSLVPQNETLHTSAGSSDDKKAESEYLTAYDTARDSEAVTTAGVSASNINKGMDAFNLLSDSSN